MTLLTDLAVALVAALHLYFLTLEMFFWERPLGLRTFKLTPEFAHASRTLAANQGLYNGFLAAGLTWGILLGSDGLQIEIFFLLCVIIAGVFGALTVSKKIFYVQALPAAVSLILIFLIY